MFASAINESMIRSEVREPIINYVMETSNEIANFTTSSITQDHHQPLLKIKALDLEQMGYNYHFGDDYARLTYRFYNKIANENQNTAPIFGFKSIASSQILSWSYRNMKSIDRRNIEVIRDGLQEQETERSFAF